jgi:hypothetical protein
VFGLKSHSIDSKGVITGNYGNGESYVIGQVALAKFSLMPPDWKKQAAICMLNQQTQELPN